jgi:hypothetical protein
MFISHEVFTHNSIMTTLSLLEWDIHKNTSVFYTYKMSVIPQFDTHTICYIWILNQTDCKHEKVNSYSDTLLNFAGHSLNLTPLKITENKTGYILNISLSMFT